VPRIIFSTVHGSHLYGLENDDSDKDRFVVTDSTAPRARQSVGPEYDTTIVGFNTFLIRALGGSHQSVEALFSPYKIWGNGFEYMEPFLSSAVVCGPAVYEKYERTIHKFCLGDFKRRRHAVRLSLNLAGLRYDGRFNPVLSDLAKVHCNEMATLLEGEELWMALTN
jgi:hypothetical protein